VGSFFSDLLFDTIGDREVLRAMPLLLIVLCVLAIAYRYYSAFLAAKVAALNDSIPTPAHTLNDGQNYHPTNRWVLFGHHFAAISGAGPLIGPVLAVQYGYMPGLLWLVIGVCLAGAVQDMLVLAASVRRGGKSLAQIALTELGRPVSIVVSLAILVIVVIALAGLGFVVVKALGGEEFLRPAGTEIKLPNESLPEAKSNEPGVFLFPKRCEVRYPEDKGFARRSESFLLHFKDGKLPPIENEKMTLPAGTQEIIPGSSWGTFTIASTIPIALFVSFWMYKFRKGKIVEASALGALGVLAAVVAGNWIPDSPTLNAIFSLSKNQTVVALCLYGFVASVLPVWLLLCPRDYISSFLKIGTIGLLVLGVFIANPALEHPMQNEVYASGGPTFKGGLFPFLFICIMCGAISGFHALVSSGTTPKMVDRESDIPMIGYGSMLIEGLVGVIALIVAASLPLDIYYPINIDPAAAARADPEQQKKERAQLEQLYKQYEVLNRRQHLIESSDVAHLAIVKADLGELEEMVGGETLRGRTGGAVTLAVGMSRIFTVAMHKVNLAFDDIVKYWYHFAIMFEALFILTTIDTGTRIARFLLQETLGKAIPKFEQTDWLPGSILATALVTVGWGGLVATGSISTIWPMFGIANQLLAVLALCLVTTMLLNGGKGRYALVTLLPMLFVISTTMTAGVNMSYQFVRMMQREGEEFKGFMNLTMTLFVMVSVGFVLLTSASRWLAVVTGRVNPRLEPE
jgi:carbon starvation protein